MSITKLFNGYWHNISYSNFCNSWNGLWYIGKKNIRLNEKAIEIALEIHEIDSKIARWIASDALRELKSEKVKKRLHK